MSAAAPLVSPVKTGTYDLKVFRLTPLDTTRGCVYNVPMNENDQTLDLGELPPCDECGGDKVWDPNGHMSHCTVCGHVEIL